MTECPECGRTAAEGDGEYCRWCGMSFAGTLAEQLAEAKQQLKSKEDGTKENTDDGT